MKKNYFFGLLLLFSTSLWAQVPKITNQPLPSLKQRMARVMPALQHRPSSVNETVLLQEDFNSGMPSSWTVVNNTGNASAVWAVVANWYGNTLDGTSFAIADSDAAGNVDMDTELQTPVITGWNPGDRVYLSFDHYFQYYSGSNDEIADVDVFDGTNWVNVMRFDSNTGSIGAWNSPSHEVVDITAYLNANLKVRFHYYNAKFEWFWAVDNVKVYVPNSDDLAIAWVSPFSWPSDNSVPFSVVLQNAGTSSQNTYDVRVTVKDASNNVVYTDVIHENSANLAYGEFKKYNFPMTWTPAMAGNYEVTFEVVLSSDQDTSNNTFTYTFEALPSMAFTSGKVYTFIAADIDATNDLYHYGTLDLQTGIYADIDSLSGIIYSGYLMGGDFTPDNQLVAVDNSNYAYFLDPSGQAHFIGFPPFLNEVITGLTFNHNTGEVYAATIDSLYMLSPYLDVVNKGGFGAGVMVGIAMDNSGVMYGLSLDTDSLYTINPNTAQTTGIGPVLDSLNYVQDIGYDRVNNKLYGTLFREGNTDYTSGLYEIDKTTGAATLIGSQKVDEYSLCAVMGNSLAVKDLAFDDWKIYPNPAGEYLSVQSSEKVMLWELYDMSGRLIMHGYPGKTAFDLDVSGLRPGEYFLKIYTKKGNGRLSVIKK